MTGPTPAAMPATLVHAWSHEALFSKAQRFVQQMYAHPADDWRFGLWSAFALELLARASLAKISPCLLADSKDWNNIYFALGFSPTAKKFVPRSIDVSAAFARLREILPAFTPELEGFSVLHMAKRNEDVHTGLLPFDSVAPTTWLPTFYDVCNVLMTSLGESLELLLGSEQATTAMQMISARKDDAAKSVLKSVAAHKTVWEAKSTEEKERLTRQASVWAARHDGHRAICPSCGSDSILTGAPIAAPLRSLDGDTIVEMQQYLPARFECLACKLKISGLAQLAATGLDSTYKATYTYDAMEYYAPDDPFDGYEPDNNEP